MITKQQLLDNKYKQFPTNSINHPLAVCGYQKTIADNEGIKYFINVYEYNFEDISNYLGSKIIYQFEELFKLSDDEAVAVTYLYNKTKSLEEIEEWFENTFKNLDCIYYEQ